MTNRDVWIAFSNHSPAKSTHLVSTGDKLLSYGWWEVAVWDGDRIVKRNGRGYSTTTATKHMTLVYGPLVTVAAVETPRDDGNMRH